MTQTRPGSGPTVLRMILGRQLQALREKAGMSYEQAAEAIYSSPWTIRRMERAEGGLKPLTVKSLLMAYGVTDVREIDTFLSLSREASNPGWWHSYDDVLPPWFRVAVGLEESASLIRAYQPQVIPGLLQTEDYIRAMAATAWKPRNSPAAGSPCASPPTPPAPPSSWSLTGSAPSSRAPRPASPTTCSPDQRPPPSPAAAARRTLMDTHGHDECPSVSVQRKKA